MITNLEPSPRCFRCRIEWGEELELIPSLLFYLSGCNLRCRFCIAEEKSESTEWGVPLTRSYFEDRCTQGQSHGVRTLQWVGGEPFIHLQYLLKLMEESPSPFPVVWKSNFYCPVDSFNLLDPFIACYVADLKFGNNECARNICGARDYFEVVTGNILRVRSQSPGKLLIRHLLLPGHFDCCFVPVIDWLAEKVPEIPLTLGKGYEPCWKAKSDPILGRLLTRTEMNRAENYVIQKGLLLN